MLKRYARIKGKNPREIVLLKGLGCAYKKCAFCDYYKDYESDEVKAFLENKAVLDEVSGEYGVLEVINSGSFNELDLKTMDYIKALVSKLGFRQIHFECHYLYRRHIQKLRKDFSKLGCKVCVKIGVESFDYDFREKILKKGIKEKDPAIIAKDFDEVCLLFGLAGQDVCSMKADILLGLANFSRVCVNLMCENESRLFPDKEVINIFMKEIFPYYKDNPRVDILLANTDFGVG